MLSHIDFLRPIAAARAQRQHAFDPDDPDHPIEPYIIMIADAYDAMTSTRSYRKALPQEVAFQELRDKSGTQFHPAVRRGADPRDREARREARRRPRGGRRPRECTRCRPRFRGTRRPHQGNRLIPAGADRVH